MTTSLLLWHQAFPCSFKVKRGCRWRLNESNSDGEATVRTWATVIGKRQESRGPPSGGMWPVLWGLSTRKRWWCWQVSSVSLKKNYKNREHEALWITAKLQEPTPLSWCQVGNIAYVLEWVISSSMFLYFYVGGPFFDFSFFIITPHSIYFFILIPHIPLLATCPLFYRETWTVGILIIL